MKRLLLLIIVCCTLCNCTMLTGEGMFTGEDQGRILISADAEGMKAFSDMQNGLVNNAVTPGNIKSSHYQMRENQEQQKTMRWGFRFGPKKEAK